MLTMQISGVLEDRLNAAAEESGRSPQELAEELLLGTLERTDPPPSPELIALLHHRIEEARRGEFVPEEEVERFLDEWQAELDARAAREA